MKKFITSLICFICLLAFEPVAISAPVDIGVVSKKDVVNACIVKNVTLQKTSQHFGFKLDIPPDVGKIYSNNINIDNKLAATYKNTLSLVNCDFKVGWQLKGDLSNIYKEKMFPVVAELQRQVQKEK